MYMTLQKFWVGKIKKIKNNTSGSIKLIKSGNKDIYNVAKDLYFK